MTRLSGCTFAFTRSRDLDELLIQGYSNLPVHWHNREMIVFDSIIVTPPYRAEDCKCANEKQEVLIRVKKALEGERKKLQEKERKMPVPGGPRKGG